MRALLQRVESSSVESKGLCIGQINNGLLVFLGIEKNDDRKKAERMAKKIFSFRIFEDDFGLMNKNIVEAGGDILIVPQFTLVADTQKGNRPGFSKGANPIISKDLFDYFIEQSRQQAGKHPHSVKPRVETGEFGANMKVKSINDGPTTFILDI